MKIAEALLLRKQLEQKVEQLRPIKELGERGILEVHSERRSINESTDEIKFQVPKVTMSDVTSEFDHYATELRKLDASIQKANWEFEVDYKESKKTVEKKSK